MFVKGAGGRFAVSFLLRSGYAMSSKMRKVILKSTRLALPRLHTFLLLMVAVSKLCPKMVVHVYENAGNVCISAVTCDMSITVHLGMFVTRREGHIEQPFYHCKGKVLILEVNFLRNYNFFEINVLHADC